MFSEKEIQDYIWLEDQFSKLIIGDIPKVDVESGEKIEPDKIFLRMVFEGLKETLNYIKYMDLIGTEVPLKRTNDSTIRADFLGVNPEHVGISIIELKKSRQTERQAFTELLAYSNHLISLFPTMSKEDIIYILISPMEERIVREAFLHALLVDGKRVIAFTPTFEDQTRIDSLKLRLWIPGENDISNFKNHYFSKNNFEVFKLVWRDIPSDSNSKEDPSIEDKRFMNSISSFVAQTMEEKNIHGFCFTSQSWPELNMCYPNSLIIVGMNPYEISFKNLYANNGYEEDLNSLRYNSFSANLNDIIQGLRLEADHIDYFESLHSGWSSNLIKIGLNTMKLLFKNVDGKKISFDHGLFSWEDYISSSIEHNYSFNYEVFPTGSLKRLYSEVLRLDYEFIAKNGLEKHPIHGDIFHLLVDSYYNHHFFDVFLDRMLGLNTEDLM
ncbi:hypothetical protein [Priestia megaterium]|uniref:hypothetical protein n=1 Tax=Priestia megaterium TaxID=1404 RepID=UPI002E1C5F40|nr:hypothetical protein [Priestia megaterium]